MDMDEKYNLDFKKKMKAIHIKVDSIMKERTGAYEKYT